MRSLVRPLVLSCSLVVAAAAGPAVAGPLENGDVVVRTEEAPGTETPWAIAEAIINAPIDKVWDVVSHCAHYKDRMPRIADSKELSRDGNVTTCEVTASMPFPLSNLVSKSRAVHTVEPGRYVRAWKMIAGDYEFNEGSWTLEKLDDARTKATYRIHARPKLPVPSSVQLTFQKGTLPEMMKKLRVASGAPG